MPWHWWKRCRHWFCGKGKFQRSDFGVRPFARCKIFAVVIRATHPTQGRDGANPAAQPPGCFSLWKNNVGAKRRQCSIKYFSLKFDGIMSRHGIFATLLHYLAKSVLLKNLLRWRADNIRPYNAPKSLGRKFRCVRRGGSYFLRTHPPHRRRCRSRWRDGWAGRGAGR